MTPRGGRPVLRSVSPEASPEEVAAIVAAIAEATRRRATTPAPGADSGSSAGSSHWRQASWLVARRAGMPRGPWRLSGRIGRTAGA